MVNSEKGSVANKGLLYVFFHCLFFFASVIKDQHLVVDQEE